MSILLFMVLITANLVGQETSESTRICYYDALGTEYVMTVRITQACPLIIEVDL
jgi:hypothetical protein